MTSAEFEAISPGLPSHQDELLTAHESVPSPAQAVKMGVTPSSGGDEPGPQGGPTGGGPR